VWRPPTVCRPACCYGFRSSRRRPPMKSPFGQYRLVKLLRLFESTVAPWSDDVMQVELWVAPTFAPA
jgi:hypothetical protein